jgi:flavorubredoxin
MAPFASHVLQGLEKLNELDIDFVCTSHGPVLTRGQWLDHNKARYLEWATPAKHDKLQIPIFYCSAYGNTERLSRHVERGIKRALPNAEVTVYDLVDADSAEMSEQLRNWEKILQRR